MTVDATPPARILLDPTSELSPTVRPRRNPPDTLEGRTVALHGIGKVRSDEFLDHLRQEFDDRGITTLRTDKPTNARLAPSSVLQQIAEQADVVVQALAD